MEGREWKEGNDGQGSRRKNKHDEKEESGRYEMTHEDGRAALLMRYPVLRFTDDGPGPSSSAFAL